MLDQASLNQIIEDGRLEREKLNSLLGKLQDVVNGSGYKLRDFGGGNTVMPSPMGGYSCNYVIELERE